VFSKPRLSSFTHVTCCDPDAGATSSTGSGCSATLPNAPLPAALHDDDDDDGACPGEHSTAPSTSLAAADASSSDKTSSLSYKLLRLTDGDRCEACESGSPVLPSETAEENDDVRWGERPTGRCLRGCDRGFTSVTPVPTVASTTAPLPVPMRAPAGPAGVTARPLAADGPNTRRAGPHPAAPPGAVVRFARDFGPGAGADNGTLRTFSLPSSVAADNSEPDDSPCSPSLSLSLSLLLSL
jgi:hypothetical protein